MREALAGRCREFIENRDAIKRVFRLENQTLYPVCANIFCARSMPAREETLRHCNELLKRNTGLFSNFRGTVRMAVVSMLATCSAPEDRIARMQENYRLLKQYYFTSDYLALVAMLLADTEGPRLPAETIARGREIYNKMKKEHPFLTSGEDSVFATLLAQSEKDDYALIADMEDCYAKLRSTFHAGNDLQAVTHVLALGQGTTLEKSARLIALFEGIKKAGGKYGKYRELPVLAALSILPVEISDAVNDLMEVDAFLADQKGYRWWIVDRKTRMMHAAMLVADEYAPSAVSEAAAMSSAIAIIAAQQTAMCAVMTSGSSSSH